VHDFVNNADADFFVLSVIYSIEIVLRLSSCKINKVGGVFMPPLVVISAPVFKVFVGG